MRIADVCGFYAPKGGGVRNYVEQKFAAARSHGVDLTVIAPGPDDRVEARDGGRVVWIESPPMPFDGAYHRFARAAPVWRALNAARPEVVEASSPWRSGWLAANWRGGAVRALVFHQDFVAAYPYTLLGGVMSRDAVDGLFSPYWAHLRRLSDGFDVTVTSGEWLARRLQRYGVRRVVAAPFGIEPGRFSPTLRDEALRRALLDRCGVPGGRLLLAIGRLHPEKRHRVILEGFARARGAQPLGLVLVGDGPARRQVERLAAKVGGVLLLGAINDRDRIARLYASADLLLHGSAAETYGLVVAEALASGLPVAAPAAGGAADLARFGRMELYPPGDALGLERAIRTLLAEASPGGEARTPTSDTHFEGLFSLYRGLQARPGRTAPADRTRPRTPPATARPRWGRRPVAPGPDGRPEARP